MAKRKPKRNPRKIPYVMLLKEFTDLTGDTTRAILLARLENLTQQKQDFDEYVEEEIARARETGEDEPTMPLTHAWIWKKAEELAEELLLVTAGKPVSEPTIRKHLKALVERGWLDERRNPKHNWDRTLQYRVNLIAIEHDSNAIGHTLPGWTFEDAGDDGTPDVSNPEPELASADNFASKQEHFVSKQRNFGAIPHSDTHTPTLLSDPVLEALPLEGTHRRSTNSLSSSQEDRDSVGRRAPVGSPSPHPARESSGNDSSNLKSQEQKPAPRSDERKSAASTASPAKALAVKATELSAAGRRTLAAALERQTELRGTELGIPHTRHRLLALRGTDEAAWIALIEHSTLKARDCVAGFAEVHAKRPVSAGKSLADAGVTAITADGKHETDLGEGYIQYGALIKDGCRPTKRGGSYVLDIRISEDGIRYHLLKGERSDDQMSGSFVEDGVEIHKDLAGLKAERERRARLEDASARAMRHPEPASRQSNA